MTPVHGLVHAKGDVVCTTASTCTYHQHNLLGIRGLQTLILGQPPSSTFEAPRLCQQRGGEGTRSCGHDALDGRVLIK